MPVGRRVWIVVLLIVVGIVGVFVAASMLTFSRALDEHGIRDTIAALTEVNGSQVLRGAGNEWTVHDQHGGVLAVVTWSLRSKLPSSIEFSQTALPPVASLHEADIKGPALELVTRWYGLAPQALTRSTLAQTSGFTRAVFEFSPSPAGIVSGWVAVDVDSTTRRIVAVWGPGRHARTASRFVTPFGPRALQPPT